MTTQRQHRKAKARSYTHCIVCGKLKTIPKQVARPKSPKRTGPRKSSTYVDPLVYESDPYCSTTCCKADHGIVSRTGMTSS